MRRSSADAVERVARHWLNRDAIRGHREHRGHQGGTVLVFAGGAGHSEDTFHYAVPGKRDELFRPECDYWNGTARTVFSDGEGAGGATTRANSKNHRHRRYSGLIAFDGNVDGDRSVIEADLDSRDVHEELDVALLPENAVGTAKSCGRAKTETHDASRGFMIELDGLGDAACGERLLREQSRTLAAHDLQQPRAF